MIYVYTSCALNFLSAAKILFRSVDQYLPEARKVLGIVDKLPEEFDVQAEGADELFTLEDLRGEFPQLEAWIFRHDVMELCTAVKPFILERLLEREDCEAALFFDCDCVLYSSLVPVFAGLERASILLTPHACLPHIRDEWMFFEQGPLKVGVFNLGFLGIKNNATGKLLGRWWKARLRNYCLIDHELGIFTDQKWMNLVPCYFNDYHVLRQSTLNVARWNTFQRKVEKTSDGTILIDGTPVDFIHYSGFYKVGGYVKGLYDAKTGPYCEDRQVLDELSAWYAAELRPDAERELCRGPWGYGVYCNGEPITDEQRSFYRKNPNMPKRFPNPFDVTGGENYLAHYRKHGALAKVQPEPAGLQQRLQEAEEKARRLEEHLTSIYQSRSWRLASAIRRRIRSIMIGR